jgi:3-oxoacyl-[acyl-carrier-protein] synthase III
MIGIKSIASYIPEDFIDNIAQAASFGENENFIPTKIGAMHLPVKATNEETSDLCVKSIHKLVNTSELSLDSIDALIVVTQNGDGHGLPHTAAIVQDKLGISTDVAAFDVSLGCSGYVYGLSILKGLMMESGLENGILITADPYSKIIDRKDRVTSLLFGDAATATWLSNDGIYDLGRPLLQTDGSGAKHLLNDNGTLHMNGRQVFNFAFSSVPEQIFRTLERNKISPEEIDYYCLHQGSAAILNAIKRKFPTTEDRFLFDIEYTGNTVSSSIPLLLEKYVIPSNANKIVICGFGVGLSWATNILTRKGK